MRIVIFLLFLTSICALHAQKGETEKQANMYGWEVFEGKLQWSKAYFTDNQNIEYFVKALLFLSKESSVFEMEKINSETLRGTFSNLSLEFEKYGYDYLDAPFLISRARHSGIIEVDVREGRYKVKIFNITSFMNKVSKGQTIYNWNVDFLDRKGMVKSGMVEILGIADKNFATIFSVRPSNQISGNQK